MKRLENNADRRNGNALWLALLLSSSVAPVACGGGRSAPVPEPPAVPPTTRVEPKASAAPPAPEAPARPAQPAPPVPAPAPAAPSAESPAATPHHTHAASQPKPQPADEKAPIVERA